MANYEIVALHSQQSDLLLQMSCLWAGIVTSSAVSPYALVPMFGPDASRRWNSSFSLLVGDRDVVLITGLGHGSVDQFTGFKGEILYSADVNSPVPPQEVQNKVIHLLSCSTANGLNTAFLLAGCSVFIGYTQDVPIQDSSKAWLTVLLTCDAQVEFSLIKGATVAAAIQEAKHQYMLHGLNYIGDLLQSTPNNSNVKLPPFNSAVTASVLASRSITSRDLPSANVLSQRNV